MRFFTFLPVVFCLGVQALPAAEKQTTQHPSPDVAVPHSTVQIISATDHKPLAASNMLEKREHITVTIEKELGKLGLNLDSTVKHLLNKLGLKAVHDPIDELLRGLVGNVDGVLGKVDEIVGDLLSDLGLGGLDETIYDVEKALGLSHKNTVRKLLRSLHLL